MTAVKIVNSLATLLGVSFGSIFIPYCVINTDWSLLKLGTGFFAVSIVILIGTRFFLERSNKEQG